MLSDRQALYPRLTVEQNLAFGLRLRGTPRAEVGRRVARAARMLGLEPYLSRHPATLPGGLRQRVAMGRAIVREPRALLMDEPLSSLEAGPLASMRAVLGQLRDRLGVTTVYVTHDQAEAMALGDRVCVMLDGTAQQADTPQRLFESPANLFVAGLHRLPGDELRRGAPGPRRRAGGDVRGAHAAGPGRPARVQAGAGGLPRTEGDHRDPPVALRPRGPRRRAVGALSRHRHRDRGARPGDPRDLPDRRPADRPRVVRRRRRAQRRGGRGRLRPGGREVAVDRPGPGGCRAPPRPAA